MRRPSGAVDLHHEGLDRPLQAVRPGIDPGGTAAHLAGLRLALGAGAPVSPAILAGMRDLLPAADIRTPYGMTEVLPVCEASAEDIAATGIGDGVLVGPPLAGVAVAISPVDDLGRADAPLTNAAGVLGEVLVSAPHGKSRYDRLWATERRAGRNPGWHRTGDLGRLDGQGRLWIEGRLQHLITGPDGPIGPVGLEQRALLVADVHQAAAVGVGPAGTQATVLVVVAPGHRLGPADPDLTSAVREAVGRPVAAVLVVDCMPVDIRHRAKIDRTRIARDAARILDGRRRS